ncbi:MAG: D-lyxose/D-mannose family sugar isomerase [Candidatus Obscuribacterales bacterium]|nr:D-lyxose/D-mannose family sugar isomerase [Candidatus Obscuribacterales bacterium]
MKRSDINRLIDEAISFFDEHKLKLPPWAYWTAEEWQKSDAESSEVRTHGMGWNITDFGGGDFFKQGLILFIVRNGLLVNGQPATTKTYAEKAMMVRPGQITPWHFHWQKTEDLINRGGGRLEVELGWATEDEKSIDTREVTVQVDGITRRLPPGGKLILEPGESVTLPPKLCHQFCGKHGDEKICVGEVSSLNDDGTDNCFLFGVGPRSIIEDVPAKYWLNSEYPNSGN